MALEAHELQPATVLRGHADKDTAYLVDDYPYGFEHRCKIRYWLHKAGRGRAAGMVRFMSQTTSPLAAGEPWNKPKATTYSAWAVMILDFRGYVRWWSVSNWGPHPSGHLLMRLRTIYDQLTEEERQGYDALLQLSRSRTYSGDWERAARAYTVIDDVTSEELREKHGIYLDDRAYQIFTAAHAAGLEL